MALLAAVGLAQHWAAFAQPPGCANAKLDLNVGQTVNLNYAITWQPSTCVAAALQVYQNGQPIADVKPGISSGSKTVRDLIGDLDGDVEIKLWMGDPMNPADAVFVNVTRSGPLQFVEDFEGAKHRVEQTTDETLRNCPLTGINGGSALPVLVPGTPDGQKGLLVYANPQKIPRGDDHVSWGIKVANSPLSGIAVISVLVKIPLAADPNESGQTGPEFSLQQTVQDVTGIWRTYEAAIQYQPQTVTWAIWQQDTDTTGKWVPLPMITTKLQNETWYLLTLEIDLDLDKMSYTRVGIDSQAYSLPGYFIPSLQNKFTHPTVSVVLTLEAENRDNCGGTQATYYRVMYDRLQLNSQTPVSVMRDPLGAIRMSSYPSATLSYLGGVFRSDAASGESIAGDVFVAARDNFNSLWVNKYDSLTQSWAIWRFGGGVFQGVPAIAVTPDGTAWISARDNSNSYWINSFSGTSWGAWTPLYGIFSTDPAITACLDGSIYVVGKDAFNSLWSGRYIPGTGFQGFQFGGGIVQGVPSITCGSDDAVYIAVRDFYSSHWVARVLGNTWTGWFFGGALTNSDPKVAAVGSRIAIVIRDQTNVIWRNSFAQGTGNGWGTWTQVGGVLADVAPASFNGELYFAGKAPNGDLWWWRQTGNQWTWIGNNGVAAGALASAPR